MIDTLIKEFIAITKYLMKIEKSIKKGDYLLIEKKVLMELLDKNAYETAENKLKTWKELYWINTDANRFTKRIQLNGKTVLVVKINLKIYQKLVELSSK